MRRHGIVPLAAVALGAACLVPAAASPSASSPATVVARAAAAPSVLSPTVARQGPAPTFTFPPTIAGLTVTINLKGAVQQDGSPAPINLVDSFDWGDGTATSSLTLAGGTSGSVTHTYARAGTYTITGTSTIDGNAVWAGCLCKTITGTQSVTVSGQAPAVNQVPVLTGTWPITGTILSNSDTTGFQGPAYAVGATLQRTWRFVQSCDATTCVTDLIRPSDLGETTTRIDYRGSNQFSWQETLTSSGTCGTTPLTAGSVRASFVMTVRTVPIPTGRPIATSLEARGDFVFTVNQAGYAALGCSPVPSQITFAVGYAGNSPSPPPSGGQVYGGPATGYPAGQVKLPGASSFTAIAPGQNIPPGTVVDVSNGRGVTLADPKGQTSVFYGQKDAVPSQFVYAGVVGGFVELRLTGGKFSARKARGLQSASAEKPVRRLWGKGKGKFRTKGRYASAAIRGTWWLTADYRTRTLVQVREGVMTVRDLAKKKTVIVRAPKSYSASPKK